MVARPPKIPPPAKPANRLCIFPFAAADAAAAALAEKQAALAAAQSAADTAGENAARALADAQAALDTAAKAYEKSKQETEFQNRQNNLDAQTAALDIEKQQAVVDALAALAVCRHFPVSPEDMQKSPAIHQYIIIFCNL